jgi:DNA helicase-2/ATP-dependent DNA helicase PcrA
VIEPTRSQVEIRDAPELGLLITAPAGCGKTEALALRVQGLVRRRVVQPPHKILVVTFTNRARDNIRERLAEYLRPGEISEHITIHNLHGLANRIVQAHGNVIGLDDGWEPPDTDWVTNQCRLLKLNSAQSGIVKGHIQAAKLITQTDEEVAAYLAQTRHPIAIGIERKRVDDRVLTYDDLPRLAALILRNDSVAELYRLHFGAVIVDEFQDLTRQQMDILQRIASRKITFAGDLAQGIYGFAGAEPEYILDEARKETTREIVFAESHRSSPAVLDLVNALAPVTGGVALECSRPESWPGGGVAGHREFESPADEAEWILKFAANVARRAPKHRIAVVTRTKYRREALDEKLAEGTQTFAWYRWDDPIFDTQTAPLLRAALRRVSPNVLIRDPSPSAYLQSLIPSHELQDPTTRETVVAGCEWAAELIRDDIPIREIVARIKIGEDHTLLTAPGLHLLTGHAGKGQQFDWVVVVGLEADSIPMYHAKSEAALVEEARVLSVMISRARHGVITTRSLTATKPWGDVVRTSPSSFAKQLVKSTSYTGWPEIKTWLDSASWSELAAR